ncbi:glycoside hydrolase family 15 protein, partial [Streptomyces sp. NPDC020792]|uniref:glycoside hydrolase family 15 protein n=1 Tax=Streptomyces sp. NPDC020792 TaxID=3365089 RepID=UPI0037AD5CCD
LVLLFLLTTWNCFLRDLPSQYQAVQLSGGTSVRRYLGDEIEETEGDFLLCTFWFAHALALTGHVVRARQVFQTALAHANDVGLLAEETDPATGEALGNYPQAFSHIGLINAARAIRDAGQQPPSQGVE